jgi:hypothetical protein
MPLQEVEPPTAADSVKEATEPSLEAEPAHETKPVHEAEPIEESKPVTKPAAGEAVHEVEPIREVESLAPNAEPVREIDSVKTGAEPVTEGEAARDIKPVEKVGPASEEPAQEVGVAPEIEEDDLVRERGQIPLGRSHAAWPG